jgi:hypothetical protein
MTKTEIEQTVGATISRKWVLDGAGPARFGWCALHPCKEEWLGRTLEEVAARLAARGEARQ